MCHSGNDQSRGNPCDPGSGNKYQREQDYRGHGPFPLFFERMYNSTLLESYRPNPLALGPQWLHSYDRAIRLDANTATVSRQDGKIFLFVLNGGVWTPDGDITDKLERLADGEETRPAGATPPPMATASRRTTSPESSSPSPTGRG